MLLKAALWLVDCLHSGPGGIQCVCTHSADFSPCPMESTCRQIQSTSHEQSTVPGALGTRAKCQWGSHPFGPYSLIEECKGRHQIETHKDGSGGCLGCKTVTRYLSTRLHETLNSHPIPSSVPTGGVPFTGADRVHFFPASNSVVSRW